MKRTLLALCAVLVLSGCSSSAPRFVGAKLRLVYRIVEGAVQERYSLMVAPEDEDGLEDLAELRLIHEASQLEWILGEGDWIRSEQSGQVWIGSHNIAAARGSTLPRGSFRLVLTDKGGNRAERILAFDGKALSAADFPTLKISGGRYGISSVFTENSLALYDASGALFRTQPLEEKGGTLSSLKLPPQAKSAALWAEDPETSRGALTEPVPLP